MIDQSIIDWLSSHLTLTIREHIKKLAFLAGHSARGGGGVWSGPTPGSWNAIFSLKKRDVLKWKTVEKLLFFYSEVIHLCGCVILYLSKLVFSSFQFSQFMIFFRGHFWIYQKSHFPGRSLLISNICLICLKEKIAWHRYCSANR